MAAIKIKLKTAEPIPQAAPVPAPPPLASPQPPPAPEPDPQAGPSRREAFHAECERRRRAGLILAGNTYPIRAQIKAAGCYWDAKGGYWLAPDQTTLDALRELLPPGDPAPRAGGRRRWRRGHWVSK